MTLFDQFRHETIDESEQQGTDMGPIHIRVRHKDNLIIPKFGDIKIFMDTDSKSGDHGFDLRVGIDFIQPGLLHIQNLAPQRQNGLGSPGSGGLGASSGGIPLHNIDFTVLGILVRTVRQLAGQSHAV